MLSQSGYIILKSLTHPQSSEHYIVEVVACVYVPNREPFLLQALYRGSPLFFHSFTSTRILLSKPK